MGAKKKIEVTAEELSNELLAIKSDVRARESAWDNICSEIVNDLCDDTCFTLDESAI